MQLSSLRALGALIQECAPRMQLWKGTIVSAVAKCWVGIIDASVEDTGGLSYPSMRLDCLT